MLAALGALEGERPGHDGDGEGGAGAGEGGELGGGAGAGATAQAGRDEDDVGAATEVEEFVRALLGRALAHAGIAARAEAAGELCAEGDADGSTRAVERAEVGVEGRAVEAGEARRD
jgi:hypothetical protein